MLDVVFINLIAAGLDRMCRTAPAAQTEPPETLETMAPAQLVRKLTETAPEPTTRLITCCVEALWQSCRAVGLPAELAEPHLAALPDILRSAPLDKSDHALFLDAATEVPEGAATELSRRIIDGAGIDWPGKGLDDVVLAYLLESFLTALLKSRTLLQTISGQVAPSQAPEPARTADNEPKSSNAAMTLAKIARADALGITVPLLEVVTVSLINLTRTPDVRHDHLEAAAADAVALDEAIAQLEIRNHRYRDTCRQALNTFRAGQLPECDRLLAALEDIAVQESAATAPPDPDLRNLAIEIRGQRAALQMLTGAFVKAARHYGFAQRHIPHADAETRWHFARKEAAAYELAAFYHRAPGSLENAARACTGALAAVPDSDRQSLNRAEAQAGLAHVLLLLGERDQEPARFELAAQLLADAHAFFESQGADPADEQDRTALHNVVALRAEALTRLGELIGNSSLLEQAAVHLQSLVTENALPIETARQIRARIALALIGYGEMEREQKLREHAAATLLSAMQELEPLKPGYNRSSFVQHMLVARSHEILARSAPVAGDETTAKGHRDAAARIFRDLGFAHRAEAVQSEVQRPDPNTDPGSSPDTDPNTPSTTSEANAA